MNDHWPVFVLAATYLLIPGYLLVVVANIRTFRFLLSYALSLGLLLLSLSTLLLISSPTGLWFGIVHLILLLICILVIRLLTRQTATEAVGTTFPQNTPYQRFFIYVGFAVAFLLYHTLAGPYTELPSDFWKHLARVQTEFLWLSDTTSISNPWVAYNYLSTDSRVVYLLQALLAVSQELEPIDTVFALTAVSSSIFLISIFSLSAFIFRTFFETSVWVLITAGFAVLLTFVSFGTATFSYVRYYAFFPTMFAFPLIFASIVIFTKFLEDAESRSNYIALLPVLFLTANVIHRQEGLLMLVILSGIAFVSFGRNSLSPVPVPSVCARRARISTYTFLISFVLVTIHAFTSRELVAWETSPHVIDLGQFITLLSDFPIDNPSFRLWDTVGVFGVLIYAWSLLRWHLLLRSSYLIAGLLVPVFTALNPLFVIVFLHYAAPTTLWRTAYLIPLAIVAALFFGKCLQQLVGIIPRWRKLINLIFAASLIFSLAPWTIGGYYNRTSRISSLAPVHQSSGAGLWADLIDATRQIESAQPVRRILTDEVTKFAIYAANRGDIWWWTEHSYFPKFKTIYEDDWSQSDLTATLLVWNRRNGEVTGNARHSGHWSHDILQIRKHYPLDLESFLIKHREHFTLVWNSGDIEIYQLSTLPK